jgi:hypothetical protein
MEKSKTLLQSGPMRGRSAKGRKTGRLVVLQRSGSEKVGKVRLDYCEERSKPMVNIGFPRGERGGTGVGLDQISRLQGRAREQTTHLASSPDPATSTVAAGPGSSGPARPCDGACVRSGSERTGETRRPSYRGLGGGGCGLGTPVMSYAPRPMLMAAAGRIIIEAGVGLARDRGQRGGRESGE